MLVKFRTAKVRLGEVLAREGRPRIEVTLGIAIDPLQRREAPIKAIRPVTTNAARITTSRVPSLP